MRPVRVSKSIPTILGLGAAACVLLGLMMRNLVEHGGGRARSPYAPAVETRFGAQLTSGVRIEQGEREHRRVWHVRARVQPKRGLQKLARAIGLEVWLGALRAGDAPDELVVVLTDADSGEVCDCPVAAPGAAR